MIFAFHGVHARKSRGNMIDYTIPQPLVERAYNAQWHKNTGRGKMYERTDLDRPGRSDRKVLVGNLAEVAAWGAFCGVKGVPCEFPNLLERESSENLWPDDLIFSEEHKFGKRKINKTHSVKGQFFTEAKEYHPSWVFQLPSKEPGRVRHGDPMLNDLNMPSLFIGVLVDDQNFEFLPEHSVRCFIYTFFWPNVSKYLADPVLEKHRGFKKVLYLRDIAMNETDYME